MVFCLRPGFGVLPPATEKVKGSCDNKYYSWRRRMADVEVKII